MRLTHALLPLLLVTGCSSFRADPENVTAVPADRLLAYQDAGQDYGRILVNRDLGMMGGGCYVAILVDRQVAARIGVGEVASFQVPRGTRVLGIGVDEQDDTLCGKGRLRREKAVKVATGQTYRYRIVSEAKGGFDIRPDTP